MFRTAIAAARGHASGVLIEVEVESLEQMQQALASRAHRLLLDNFSIRQLADAVALRDQRATDVKLEASGGITLANVRASRRNRCRLHFDRRTDQRRTGRSIIPGNST